jgi:hypothetical protein
MREQAFRWWAMSFASRPAAPFFGLAFALAFVAIAAQAQIPGAPWYRGASGLLGMPPTNVSARDVERMERLVMFGAPYCASLPPAAYAANLAMARNMGTYLASVGSTAADPQARIVALRLAASFSSFPCAYPGKQLPPAAPPPPPKPGDPPFALMSPNVGKVPDAEHETAADLTVRYDTDVARSAAAWKNAETLRLSLVQKGMTLNGPTASAVIRLGPLYDDAAAALKAHNWEEALSNLQAAEATTQKVEATVGH